MRLKSFVCALFAFCACVHADYKIGSNAFIRSDDIERVFKTGLYLSKQDALDRMILVHSVIVALKLQQTIPQHVQRPGLPYESDEALFNEYCAELQKSFEVTATEVAKMEELYQNMFESGRVRFYQMREICLVGSNAAQKLEVLKTRFVGKDNAAVLFMQEAEKISQSASKVRGGYIGNVNSNYFPELRQKEAGEMFIVKRKNSASLYFIENVMEKMMPSADAIAREIMEEKIMAHLCMLLVYSPVCIEKF